MTQLTIDQALGQRLLSAAGPVELHDETGKLVGYFHPAVDPELYQGVDSPLSEEELRRREQGTVWYTTAEVLARLEQLQ